MNNDPTVEREVRDLLVGFMADPDRLPLVADVLNGHPDYRVLRRFKPQQFYGDQTAPVRALRRGLFVDVETTGLDPETDEIIQLAILPFIFDNEPTGGERIVQVLQGHVWLEEPSTPIPPEVEELTGITNEDVKGHRIPDGQVENLTTDVVLIVAHFAEFDRRRIERRFPSLPFASLPWACSSREVEWVRRYGAIAAKLGAALGAFGEFTDDAHDALEDCRVGVHVLGSSMPCQTCGGQGFEYAGMENGAGWPCKDCVAGERRPFVDLLRSARRLDYRIHAYDSPFEVKDRLAARKYKWQPEKPGVTKNWYRDVKATDVESERAWLLEVCGPNVDIRFTKIGARDRYSIRA